ncbi:MAG: tetratricopeptide repeat protein [Gammaproteobacteria bacterium]|nr:tetratricopeptide repeat protein [Gammaproteobacteria bacterium]
MRIAALLLGGLALAWACAAAAGQLEEARVLVQQHQYVRALHAYAPLLRQKPDDPNLLIEVARVNGWANRHAQAIALYERVVHVAPARREDVLLPLAWQLVWANRPAQAVPYFEAYLRRHPHHPQVWLGLAGALAGSGKPDAAVAAYDRVLAVLPENWNALLGKARVLVQQHQYVRALHAYAPLLRQKPDDPNLLIEVARVNGWANRHAQAIALYERVVHVAPARREDVLLPLAWQLVWANRPAQAVPYFEAYLRRHPHHPQVWLGLAGAVAREGHDQVLAVYRKALVANPGDLTLRNGQARTLLQSGDYAAAKGCYEAILRQHPGDFSARIGLARILNWTDHNRAAAVAYENLLGERPADRSLLHDLATAQYWSGFDAEALHTLRGLHDPSDERLRHNIERDYAPWVSATLGVSNDTDNLTIVSGTVDGAYRINSTDWLGATYRNGYMHENNAGLGVSGALNFNEGWIRAGTRLGDIHSRFGTVWPGVAIGVRDFGGWDTFAWKASAKWFPADLWRVDIYGGNEVIENLPSIENHVRFTSVGGGVHYQFLPRVNAGLSAGTGSFSDRFGDSNNRNRYDAQVLGVLYTHPRITAMWNFLYLTDSNPDVYVGYYNPASYWENRFGLGFDQNWNRWSFSAHGGLGRIWQSDPGMYNDLYFYRLVLARDVGANGELRLVAGRSDSRIQASTAGSGYARSYASLGYVYRSY